MPDHDIILAIQEMLDGTIWHIGMLSEIADMLAANGYRVRNEDEVDVQEHEVEA